MAVRVALRHVTRYRYARPVTLLPQVVRLRPAPHCRTPVEAYSLRVEPSQHFLNWQQDPFGNFLARAVFPDKSQELTVEVGLVANLVTLNPFDFFLESGREHYPFAYTDDELRQLSPYLEVRESGPKFEALCAQLLGTVARGEPRVVDLLVAINQRLQRTLKYDIRLEPGVFSPEQTLSLNHGSCRDFAWLLVNVLRRLGIAARFASGYSIQLVADRKPLEGPAGVSADCVDLHAWAEAFLPGAGWLGLDATSGLLCGEGHIPLACTAEPTAAAPITGSYESDGPSGADAVDCAFSVEMSVERLEDRPRPTKSYSDSQWAEVMVAGRRLERHLAEQDVRLTMGGEPTFVSADDMQGAEWNTEALGPTKARFADSLLRRLREAFAPGGVMLHGQGKWYPGEPLPRWAYSLIFRRDGVPIWGDPGLIDDGSGARATSEVAQRFAEQLLGRLGLPAATVLPAHEDAFYYLWRERRLPPNVDPLASRLDEPLERARLARVFEQGLDAVVGVAVPLRANLYVDGHYEWETGPWSLRSERMYLVAGDSPMGYRLPLDSLPWQPEQERVAVSELDPMAPRQPLQRRAAQAPRVGSPLSEGSVHPHQGDVVRTALCVESRAGILHVFLPPLPCAEAWLALVGHIEQTARRLGTAVRLEGYPPPHHPDLERLSVTPDPGVLEVNVHPSQDWTQLVERTTTLYELARQTRLGTDKFLLDGRHSGTGGGNHVVLGGATPWDSPFLRRPELLTSLVAFFNNHPSLSYLFSGLFVGPTSQAPRLDEARNDSLYEFELARRTLRSAGESPPPWLVDRALRHLLVDVTGNTHRAEFCIDKLYNPDSASGRLGLVELRSFEMPPDARMSLAQQLLVRALVARFWREPYRAAMVRWGTVLHDRFALPHFLWEDLGDALEELSFPDLELKRDWFRPHLEFRFPFIGRLCCAGLNVEVRQALEPWHVLGEERNGAGTARYVDSSVERIELVVDGLTETRHCLVAGGRALALHPTGRAGQFVGAIRYKAWKPPSSLHPTLDVNVPLVVQVYDTWNRRSLGAFTYHVAHPGGRAFETFPSNGLEAESRRMARFLTQGHCAGAFDPASPHATREFPLTLDLRQPTAPMGVEE